MFAQSPRPEDKHRCVVVFRYKILNATSLTPRTRSSGKDFVEIEIKSGTGDVREEYANPVTKEDRDTMEVRVYDEKAIDIRQAGFLGDYTDAMRKCERALQCKGYTVVRVS